MSDDRDADTKRGIDQLLWVVGKLRGKDGCPWDCEQTLDSLKQYLIEESYEVVDAVDSGDPDRHEEELGDVLLQIILQAQIRKEKGDFSFDDVANRISEKLIRRHPHVFGDAKVSDSEHVLKNWEVIKAGEKKHGKRSAVEGIPRHLPALQKAQRVQSRASHVGFDWTDVKDVVAKVEEELAETKKAISEGSVQKIKEEVGDLLFAVVNLCRFQRVNAEEAMEDTIAKFVRRFQEVERRIHGKGQKPADCTLDEMDMHWEAVKEEVRDQPPPRRSGAMARREGGRSEVG